MTFRRTAAAAVALSALPAAFLAAPYASNAAPHSAPHSASHASAKSSCSVKEASAKRSNKPPHVPHKGHAYFGGFSWTEPQSLNTSFSGYEQKSCRPADIAHDYLRGAAHFPDGFSTTEAKQGKVILLSWTGFDEADMAAGKDNAAIETLAREVKAFHHPVLFEFRWEMNIPNNQRSVHSPSDYIKSWDLARKIFTQEKVKNASWVWCPAAWGFVNGSAQKYYPGDSEVDWICSEAYDDYRLGKKSMSDYQSPGYILSSFMKWQKHHHKPVLIGEAGVPQSYSPGARARWFRQLLKYSKKHPAIRGLAYFDHVAANTPASNNVALGDNPTVIAGLRKLSTSKHFRFKTKADPHG